MRQKYQEKNTTSFPEFTLPHNNEAERATIGAMLLEKTAIYDVIDFLKPEMFYDEFLKSVYEAILQVEATSKVDAITVIEQLRKTSEKVDIARIALLSDEVASSAHIETHARIVYQDYMRRKLMLACAKTIAECNDLSIDVSDLIDNQLADIESISNNTIEGETVHIARVASEAFLAYQEREKMAKDGATVGIHTGLNILDKALHGFQPGGVYILAARPAMGKEQPLTSKILTPSGYTTMGNIQLGQTILGGDGKECTVTGIFPQGYKEVYRITFSDGYSCECGIEHLWNVRYTNSANKAFKTLSLKEILGKGLFNTNAARERTGRKPRPKFEIPVTPIFGDDKSFFIHPYVLGVLIGDGYMMGSEVSFSNPDIDNFIARKVEKLLPENYWLNKVSTSTCPHYSIRKHGYRNGYLDDLMKMGLRVRSRERFIPKKYLYGSYEQRLDLMRGLMDTDGSVCGTSSIFSTTSKRLADDIVSLAQSIGGVARINENKREKRTEYNVNINLPVNPFSLPRKAEKVPHVKKRSPKRFIVDVEKIGWKECQCIMVDNKDGLYITDNYIVTHNTAFMLNIARKTAKFGNHVFIVSLEMTRRSLVDRMVIAESGINSSDYKAGRLNPDEFVSMAQGQANISLLPIEINDTALMTVQQIKSQAKKLKRKGKCDIILIDYLQLIEAPYLKGRSKNDEVSATTRAIKIMAKDLGVPVVLLSQLSREVEKRADKIPMLSDLRDSGAIEQDADAVLFIHRESYYNDEADPRTGIIRIAKNREERTGDVEFWVDETISNFRDEAPRNPLLVSSRYEKDEDEDLPF